LTTLEETKHIAIIGKKGTGKDTLARAIIKDLLDKGSWIEKVYSNTQMYEFHDTHPWNTLHTNDCKRFYLKNLKLIHYLRQLEHAKNSIVYVAEISKAIPSRKVGHHMTEIYDLIQEVMNRLRKRNCPFIYSDQWRRGADVMIRTNVDYLFQPALTRDQINDQHGNVPLLYLAYTPKGTEFLELEKPTETGVLMHTEMNIRDIFPLFKTEEIIPITYNPPFEIDKWTKAFVLWCAKKAYIIKGMKGNDVRNVLQFYQVKTKNYISNKELSAVLGKLNLEKLI